MAAEPFFVAGIPWRVLMTAVRRDCAHLVAPWVERLGGGQGVKTFQTV